MVWWNFNVMRKYFVERQPYGVLNFSVMECDIP